MKTIFIPPYSGIDRDLIVSNDFRDGEMRVAAVEVYEEVGNYGDYCADRWVDELQRAELEKLGPIEVEQVPAGGGPLPYAPRYWLTETQAKVFAADIAFGHASTIATVNGKIERSFAAAGRRVASIIPIVRARPVNSGAEPPDIPA